MTWFPTEIKRLREAVKIYGNHWKVVAAFVGQGRTPVQCQIKYRRLKNAVEYIRRRCIIKSCTEWNKPGYVYCYHHYKIKKNHEERSLAAFSCRICQAKIYKDHLCKKHHPEKYTETCRYCFKTSTEHLLAGGICRTCIKEIPCSQPGCTRPISYLSREVAIPPNIYIYKNTHTCHFHTKIDL